MSSLSEDELVFLKNIFNANSATHAKTSQTSSLVLRDDLPITTAEGSLFNTAEGSLFTSAEGSSLTAAEGSSLSDMVNISTSIPTVMANVLSESKLAFLAEVGHYRLHFPMVLNRNESGHFSPAIGVPEVFDTRGAERSWRVTDLENVTVIDNQTEQPIEVLSLSSSGLTVKMHDTPNDMLKSGKLILNNGLEVDLDFEPVRSENGIMAAKINAQGEASEALRHFLFGAHKAKYSHLYKV
ncbi:hypothetical protein [Shewanella gaetbuli]|uniref:PilZ domain-containing protein n=1 Tax=Shewanella gaetbuli TaxID=220752 RepID=A0A9X1ZM52_9GAMM|nr:hypothetical protein [Shewanella gaetbuli]MCL1142410.1 hypothetical protein [Shewanella gaetbuli]